ncbi:hypothetical protein DCAR_0310046 [Daucus carota subsp. sativus]|uniref:NB-ARC domain-containing protein n=1 Tax=Daucus carota subsp. sativus TaxID=79200 RepID=A0AAF0WIZ7_DAUCS|nr:hypothetical protein DCAR_0310046 [Daucus carota subsp. sativus]
MPNSDTTFEEFQSRKDAYQKLWDSLVNEDGPLIHGIYGMAGVGKTRMMEQFWEDAIKKKIFKKAVRVNVGSENVEKTKLQEQIAGLLDCNLASEVMERRASQLENSLRNGDKILLILDDVWRDIHLDNIIGTPFDNGSSSSKGSKILFTSRKKEVCLHNNCKNFIEVQTLSPDEALYLFKKTVGSADSNNPLPDESLVKEVCDKCGQLPLLIHAVGKALKGKPHYWWKDAHDQLKKGKFEEITDVDPQVYIGIKLSIDYLQNDDAKSCLFLCSMFPEDANIDMKMLIQLATGSQLIPSGESRVLAMVDYLKKSSLLLDSRDNAETKVHDIIRDVARSIAFTDSKYAFLQVTCSSRYLPSQANNSTRRFLRLDVETDVDFGEHQVFPDLHTLWLQSNYHPWWGQSNRPQQFSGGFYSMFVNLSCLMLQSVDISSKHFSLQPLGNLGTLSLLECEISNTDARLFPKSLESLCIYECKLPEPLDVENLECLRKLEIQGRRAVLVRENVISSLSSLEELHVSHGFVHSYYEYHMEPIVKEISKLTRLTSLHFEFYEDNTFQGTDISFNIDRYNIFVGQRPHEYSRYDQHWEVPLTRSIELMGNHSKPWEGLIVSAEQVVLCYSNVDASSIFNDHKGAFDDLKILNIYICDNMGHLARISRDGIQDSVQSATCFSKLSILKISRCSKLKYLFCNNIAKTLVQLQELSVDHYTSDKIITLNRVSTVHLEGLPKFKNIFYGATYECYMPALKDVKIVGCGLSVLFTCSVFRVFQLQKLHVSHCESLEHIVEEVGGDVTCDRIVTLSQLATITLEKLPKLRSFFHNANYEFHMPVMKKVKLLECGLSNALFTRSVFRNLKQMEELSVCDCELLEGIFEDAKAGDTLDTSDKIITLNRVSTVHLEGLPKFKNMFYGATYECYMPALKDVRIVGCGLSVLFTFSVFRGFQQLENLHVSNCESLEHIVEEAGGDEISEMNSKTIKSSKLSSVTLESLPNLKSFSGAVSYVFDMSKLQNFRLINCPRIDNSSSSKINTSLVCVTSDWCNTAKSPNFNLHIFLIIS